ncbi:MAG: glycoside hydrolase family 26 protein [Planctomycetota bacterium]|jgi:beta-mannanase
MRWLLVGLLALTACAERGWNGEWGLYQICWGRRFEPMLDAQLPKFSRGPDYIMFYRDLGRPYPRPQIEVVRERDSTPIISLELWQWMAGRKGSYLPAINRGEWDDFFRRWGEQAREDNRRVLLRFGFEMNGDWFTWSGDPEAFVAAWRRAHRLVAAPNVEWVWSPNVVSVPDGDMHRYYPGDAFVDWVGVDGYNFGDDHNEWHSWESFESIFDNLLDDFANRYADKPVMIAETASAPGPERARWIRDAHAYLATRPRVKAVVWFHYDKRREGEPDWRIDTTPGSLKAFNETFARPRR